MIFLKNDDATARIERTLNESIEEINGLGKKMTSRQKKL
jgi:hypothetical protein